MCLTKYAPLNGMRLCINSDRHTPDRHTPPWANSTRCEKGTSPAFTCPGTTAANKPTGSRAQYIAALHLEMMPRRSWPARDFPSVKQAKEQRAALKAKNVKPNRPLGSAAYVLDRDTGRVVVHVAGACINNQSSAIASAGTGLFCGVEHPDNQSLELPGYVHTNARADLVALLNAYKLVRARNDDQQYEIRSVSMYAINCVTVWCTRWLSNGWRNAKRKPVANADLIQAILAENGALSGANKVTLKHSPKSDHEFGIKQAKKLAIKGVPKCRDVLCGCGKVLTHVKKEEFVR